MKVARRRADYVPCESMNFSAVNLSSRGVSLIKALDSCLSTRILYQSAQGKSFTCYTGNEYSDLSRAARN